MPQDIRGADSLTKIQRTKYLYRWLEYYDNLTGRAPNLLMVQNVQYPYTIHHPGPGANLSTSALYGIICTSLCLVFFLPNCAGGAFAEKGRAVGISGAQVNNGQGHAAFLLQSRGRLPLSNL